MSTTTIVLIIAAVAVMAVVLYFGRPGRGKKVAVVATDSNEDPALSATGEAMIVGDVIPIDSGEPVAPPGTAEPQPRAAPPPQHTPAQVYEAPRQSASTVRAPAANEDAAAERPAISWTRRFEPRDGALDDATRLTLIRDLGIVRAPWGVPLLTQAYEEEPAVEHRRAALRALAAYRHPDTQPTFETALRADDEESCAIAATALGALKIRAALPS